MVTKNVILVIFRDFWGHRGNIENDFNVFLLRLLIEKWNQYIKIERENLETRRFGKAFELTELV